MAGDDTLEGPIAKLFCFPYTGASKLAFSAWSGFSEGVEVVAVDYPGHLMRPDEKLARSMEDLVWRLSVELAGQWDVPFVLLGSSLGGLVAFELARVAEARRCPPAAVVVASCPGPSRLWKHVPIAGLGDNAFLAAFMERYDGLSREVVNEPGARALILPMVRADMELFEAYCASSPEPIASDVIAVAGEDDTAAPVDDVAAWQEASTGSFDLLSVPGDHFVAQSQSQSVMDLLRERLRPRLP